MSVTETERMKIFNWFEEHMGSAEAETMMRLLPPVGWADVATKRDLDAQSMTAKRDLDAHAAEMKHAVGDRLDARLDSLEMRMEAMETRVDAKIDAAIASAKVDLQRTFITWLFASQGAAVAVVGVLLALFN